MQYRHEWKHEINRSDLITLRQRLRAVAKIDPHAIDGRYMIRSLYFDTPADKALREKLDGVNRREKFRIRYYNGDTSLIHLERKSKLNGLGTKASDVLTAGEAQAIINGSLDWMAGCSDRPLVQELYSKMRSQNLRPKTIVDYTREPFYYPPRQCPGDAGLRHPNRAGLYRLSESRLRHRPGGRRPHLTGSEVGRLSPRYDPGGCRSGKQTEQRLFQIRTVPYLRLISIKGAN